MDANLITATIAAFTGLLGAAGAIWNERRKADNEKRTVADESDDKVWKRAMTIQEEQASEISAIRTMLRESESARIKEAATCEERITQVEADWRADVKKMRADFASEADELRSQVRGLSKLCHSQQVEIDTQANTISALNRRINADQMIPGGRRASDPPTQADMPAPAA